MKYVKKVKPFHKDRRGKISHLLPGDIKIISALWITCQKGAIRANHYHKKDSHYSYMVKGSMEYTYKNIRDESSSPKTIVVKAGEIVYSPPMIAHAMRFLEDSVFLALTTEERGQGKYERDTVRVKLIK